MVLLLSSQTEYAAQASSDEELSPSSTCTPARPVRSSSPWGLAPSTPEEYRPCWDKALCYVVLHSASCTCNTTLTRHIKRMMP